MLQHQQCTSIEKHCKACKLGMTGLAFIVFALQIAGMKLEGDKAPPVQRHSAPIPAAGKPEEPIAKHVTAALRQSAPAPKVKLCLCGASCDRPHPPPPPPRPPHAQSPHTLSETCAFLALLPPPPPPPFVRESACTEFPPRGMNITQHHE